MNQRTAKLLRKSANIMAYMKMKEDRKQVDQKRIYRDLKNQWNNTPVKKRHIIRKSLIKMVNSIK